MSKDYMTEGHAAWITYADPAGTVPSEKTNPWETPIGAADQFAPIVDKNGIALFRKTFTVRELKAAQGENPYLEELLNKLVYRTF